MTLAFGVIYFGSRKVLKKGLSPIGLICLAALTGVAVYGI
jgi:chromate transporter